MPDPADELVCCCWCAASNGKVAYWGLAGGVGATLRRESDTKPGGESPKDGEKAFCVRGLSWMDVKEGYSELDEGNIGGS